jgi:hypothetical protein
VGGGQSDARVAVLPLAGKRARAIDKALTRVVRQRYEVVPGKRYRKAARKLKAKSSRAKHIRKVARKLDLDAVVESVLKKRGKKRYELKIRLLAGDTGKELSSFKMKLKRRRLSGNDERRLQRKLYAALGEVQVADEPEEEDTAGSSNRRPRN